MAGVLVVLLAWQARCLINNAVNPESIGGRLTQWNRAVGYAFASKLRSRKLNLRQFSTRLIIPIFALCSVVLAIDVDAQSACKGLSKTQCGGNQSCTWVSGFTRGDGAKVSAHCRAKGGGGNKKSSKGKKSDTKKSTKSSDGKKKSSRKSSDKPKKSAEKTKKTSGKTKKSAGTKSSKTKKSSKAKSSSKKKSSNKSKSK